MQVNLLDYTNPIYNITYLENNNFTIDTNGTTAFITALNDSIPGSYYLTFYLNGDAVEVYVASSSGSGGSHHSSSSYINNEIKDENWTCGEYVSCIDGIAMRECKSESGRIVKDLKTCSNENFQSKEYEYLYNNGSVIQINSSDINNDVTNKDNYIISFFKSIINWFRNLFN